MSAVVTSVAQGRGAWTPKGGLLKVDGSGPGPYYRSPASGRLEDMPGGKTLIANRTGGKVDLDTYAVHMGVRAIQAVVGASVDGAFGEGTGKAVKAWQDKRGLFADGVFGPTSARVAFAPVATRVAMAFNGDVRLVYALLGHTGTESAWDPAAVGYVVPADLGLNQINGDAHPDISRDDRLTPGPSLAYAANFIASNIAAFKDVDDAIAAYNLGQGGARSWIAAGRPRLFRGADVPAYIAAVHRAADAAVV